MRNNYRDFLCIEENVRVLDHCTSFRSGKAEKRKVVREKDSEEGHLSFEDDMSVFPVNEDGNGTTGDGKE